MPYMCTVDGCQHKLQSFASRSSWANHEFQKHRLEEYWACPKCSQRCCSTRDWEHHLDDVHNQNFSGPDLAVARMKAYHIRSQPTEEIECPFCRVLLGKSRPAFVKHVGRHMEDIALMALPRNAEEDTETGSPDTNSTSDEDDDTSMDLPGVVRDKSHRDDQHGPAGKRSRRTPHLSTIRRNKRLTSKEREEARCVRKANPCQDCRKAKRKVSIRSGSDFSTVTNTSLVYTCPARRSAARRSYTVTYLTPNEQANFRSHQKYLTPNEQANFRSHQKYHITKE